MLKNVNGHQRKVPYAFQFIVRSSRRPGWAWHLTLTSDGRPEPAVGRLQSTHSGSPSSPRTPLMSSSTSALDSLSIHMCSSFLATGVMDALCVRCSRRMLRNSGLLSIGPISRANVTTSAAPPSTEPKPEALHSSTHGKRRRPLTAEQRRFLDSAVSICPSL